MNISLKNRVPGFYAALALIVLNIVTAFVYVLCYNSSRYMSWFAFAILLVVAVAGVALYFTDKLNYFATVSFVGSLISIGAFVLSTFNYMVDAYVGIDVTSLSAGFISCVVLLVLLFVGSFVCNLLKTE